MPTENNLSSDYYDNQGRYLEPAPEPFNQKQLTKKKLTNDFFGVRNTIEEGPTLWKYLLAELLGTMTLTFIGCASCLYWDAKYPPPVLMIAFAFGTARASVTQAIGHISGCHINPAVTLSFIIAGYMGILKGILYIIFQCVGAIMGALFLAMVTPKQIQGNLGCTVPHHMVTPMQAVAIEAFITCLFCLTVFSIADDVVNGQNGSGGLELGFVIIACHIAAIKFTGSSMNPARSLGPAIVANIWTDFWVYWVGPCGGGVIAALIYSSSFFMGKPPRKYIGEDEGSDLSVQPSNINVYEPLERTQVNNNGKQL